MGFKFLTDEWFDEVKALTEAAGDLGLSDAAKGLTMNIRVTWDEDDCDMCIGGGAIVKGLSESAPITITVPLDVAQKMFVDQDQNAGTQAYMSGKLKIDGDMTKLMASVSIQPTPAQEELSRQIQDITD